MDVSNPVQDHHKTSVKELLKERGIKRQDFTALRLKVAKAERIRLAPDFEDLMSRQEAKMVAENMVKELEKKLEALKEDDLATLDMEKFVAMGPVPITTIRNDEGLPVHPPTVSRVKSNVSVARNFHQLYNAKMELEAALHILPQEVLERIYGRFVYSSGTRKGFQVRLEKQMLRKTASSMQAFSGTRYVQKKAFETLDRLFGVKEEKLVDVFNTPLEELIEGLKMTATSSAGFPYCRNNRDSLPDVIGAVMPKVVEALKSSKEQFLKFQQENPELFLVEVKNKLDRYEVSKLAEKTRPYVCLPAHFKILFSVLCQYFQLSLETFDYAADCSNAYGFSGAHGGWTRFYKWMLATEVRKMRYCCYGDDTCVTYRDREGKLWRVDPDFEQMDGSVDRETIGAVCQWVYSSFEKKYGRSIFWARVAALWAQMACTPRFIVDGQETYRKPAKQGGLMTGVVGTTLFDTVKAMSVWEAVKFEVETAGLNPMDEPSVQKIAKRLGMVIKKGTFTPALVPEGDALPAGTMITQNKFLGQRMQVQYTGVEGYMTIVPSLTTLEWMELLLTPRVAPTQSRGTAKKSLTEQQRTRFDQYRGYLVTGAVFDDEARAFIYSQIDRIPLEVVLMRVQVDEGRGAKLLPSPFLDTPSEPFHYPNSSGVPNYEWALNLYAPEYAKTDSYAPFTELVPSETLVEVEGDREQPLAVQLGGVEGMVETNIFEYTLLPWEPEELPVTTVMGEASNKAKTPFIGVSEVPKPKPPKRPPAPSLSKILDAKMPPRTLDDGQLEYTSLSKLSAQLGVATEELAFEAAKRNLIVLGDALVPGYAIVPQPPKTYASVVSAAEKVDPLVVDELTQPSVKLLADLHQANPHVLPTDVQPEMVPKMAGYFPQGTVQERFMKYLNTNKYRAQFETVSSEAFTVGEGPDKKSLAKVTVRLFLQPGSSTHEGWKDEGPRISVATASAGAAKEAREAIMRYLTTRWTGRKNETLREKVTPAMVNLPKAPAEAFRYARLNPVVEDVPMLAPVPPSVVKPVEIPAQVADWFESMQLEEEFERILRKLQQRTPQRDVKLIEAVRKKEVESTVRNPEPLEVKGTQDEVAELGETILPVVPKKTKSQQRQKASSPNTDLTLIRARIIERIGAPKNATERKQLQAMVLKEAGEVQAPPRPLQKTPLRVVSHQSGDVCQKLTKNCLVAQCVSNNFQMSAGVAAQIEAKMCMRDELKAMPTRVGETVLIEDEECNVAYLITKSRHYDKPTMTSMREALEDLKTKVLERGYSEVNAPLLGCGLDGLEWQQVQGLIEELYKDTGVKFVIWHQKRQARQPSKPALSSPDSGRESGNSQSEGSSEAASSYRLARRRQNKNRRLRLRERARQNVQ